MRVPDAAGDRRAELCKVLDFGIAKVLRDEASVDQLETQPGTVFGTPRFMSPAQAQGSALDARRDLFSLGLILYQTLAGRPPFADSDAVVVMARYIKDEAPTFSAVAPMPRRRPGALASMPRRRPVVAAVVVARGFRAGPATPIAVPAPAAGGSARPPGLAAIVLSRAPAPSAAAGADDGGPGKTADPAPQVVPRRARPVAPATLPQRHPGDRYGRFE